MTSRDGNGWTRCDLGHRHWGRYGAAGLLLNAVDQVGRLTVLLEQRSWWVHHGGSWGPPGGARDSHESVERAALREAIEECAIDTRSVRVHGVLTDDHGGWTYDTVIASAPATLEARAVSEESSEVAWIAVAEVERLPLHPGFASQWPALRRALSPVTVIVDAANVIGSRADGWWRDRAGAARRLCREIEELALIGVSGLPDSLGVPALDRWFPRFVVVLEGAAAAGGGTAGGGAAGRGAGDPASGSQVQIVRATGSGDDEIARQAAEITGSRLVVTADRELRSRCAAAGAAAIGPRWLLDLLDQLAGQV